MHFEYEEGGIVQRVPITGKNKFLVGRSKDCDITTAQRSVSRKHCEFTIRGDGSVIIKDLESTSGTRVNNKPVRRAQVNPGDVVSCGALIIRLVDAAGFSEAETRQEGLDPAQASATVRAAQQSARSTRWQLQYMNMAGEQTTLTLADGVRPKIIGRRKDTDIQTNNPAVGRHHAQLMVKDGQLHVQDLNSSNGTFIDGKRINKVILDDPTTVVFGNFEIVATPLVEAPLIEDYEYEEEWEDLPDEEMSPPSWHLVYTGDDGRIMILTMGPDMRIAAIGADSACEIHASGRGAEPDHAEITWEEGVAVLRDLDTQVGTHCNGKRIDERVLRNNDRLRCGNFQVRVVRGSDGAASRPEGSTEAEYWARVLERKDSALHLTFMIGDEGTGLGRRELTFWADGDARLETLGQGELVGRDVQVSIPFVDLIFDALLRGGFPDAPEPDFGPDDDPPEITVYHESTDATVVLDDKTTYRSQAYRETAELLRTVVKEIQET